MIARSRMRQTTQAAPAWRRSTAAPPGADGVENAPYAWSDASPFGLKSAMTMRGRGPARRAGWRVPLALRTANPNRPKV